jgi:hypothetical protein
VEPPGTAPGSDPLITSAFMSIVRVAPDRSNIGPGKRACKTGTLRGGPGLRPRHNQTQETQMRLTLPLAAALMMPLPLMAQDRPPADGTPLSQMLAVLEQEADFGHFEDIDWDDDGYYEVEYYTADGEERDVRLDPVTGAAR